MKDKIGDILVWIFMAFVFIGGLGWGQYFEAKECQQSIFNNKEGNE